MEDFDYSKCTYEELNRMLKRFRRNKIDYIYHKTYSKNRYFYTELANTEYDLIKKHLYTGKYIDSDERYNRYYNDTKAKLSKTNSIKEINAYARLGVLSCSSKQEDSSMIDGIEKAIRERVEELKLTDRKRQKIKDDNKRRFLLKGRV